MARAPYIRPQNRATSFGRVRDLKCFSEVHKLLTVEGWSLRAVARFVREDRNELTDVGEATVVGLLHRYRQSIPAAERAKALVPAVDRAREEVERGLDELAEMERLYKIQMQRIDIDFKTEQQIKKLLPSMTQEIRTAREILGARAQLKMDLGLDQRQLGTVEVETKLLQDVAERYADSPSVGKVLGSGDSRRRILGLAERLLSISDRADRNPDLIDQLNDLVPADPGGAEAAPAPEAAPDPPGTARSPEAPVVPVAPEPVQ